MNRVLHVARLGWSYSVSNPVRLSYPPYQFTIEPTNICNLRCTFCPQSDPQHHARREAGRLSVENLRLFLQRRRDAKPSNRNINFTLDGEPFINTNFVQLVQIAVQEGLFVIFASNGTLLSPKVADRLIAAGPFRASIDFAPDRDVYESLRGRKGDHEMVYRNLSYLIGQAQKKTSIHLDVHDITPFTHSDPSVSLSVMRKMFPGNLPRRVRFLSREFHNFCGHIKGDLPKERYRLCPYPWTQMAVTWSGDCVACCRDTAGRSVLGNVFQSPVMDIWNGERYQQFRKNLIERRPEFNAACKDCDLPFSGGERRWKLGYKLRSLLAR